MVRGRRCPGEPAEPEIELRQEDRAAFGEEREDWERVVGERARLVQFRLRRVRGGRLGLGGALAAAAAAACPADGDVAQRAALRPVAAAGAAVVARLRGAVVVVVAELGVGGAAPRALQLRLLLLALAVAVLLARRALLDLITSSPRARITRWSCRTYSHVSTQ